MTNVIVTGSAGFAGSHFVRHILVNTDWTVTAVISYDHKGHPRRLESAIEGLDANRVTTIPVDLRKPLATATGLAMANLEPSYIVNYAAESDVFRSIADPRPFVENNVELMLTVLDFARTLPSLKAFVQISTDEVYGACYGEPHKEWSTILPSNPYAASKAAQEAIAISYWRTYGVPLVLVNCMNMIGELQDPEKFVPMVTAKVLSGDTVPIHADWSGKPGSRHWIHARNLADGILYLLEHTGISVYGEMDGVVPMPARWNIVGEEVDNLTMAQMISSALDKPLHYELVDFHTSRPGHDLRYALDGRKLELAGWKAPISLDKTIKSIVEWEALEAA